MSSLSSASEIFLNKLQHPIPQYVLGCIPVIAIIGANPITGLWTKLQWIFRCLGCPFCGLIYVCAVSNDKTDLCTYWLDKDKFVGVSDGSQGNFISEGVDPVPFRPVGQYAKKFYPNNQQLRCFDEATSEPSALERLSSLASAYYIFVGWAMSIFKIITLQKCNDWPYIPISLSWTIPVIYKRAMHGRLVFKDVQVELDKLNLNENERLIPVKDLNPRELRQRRIFVAITAFISIVVPW
ncbi:1762_t:CDS:1 [Cetraspora pellucida]|uniref:1762_t:CDS:1 n=1 Tax=Cetraspora pellucida TaxID=1433469 RepID=A0ACA9KWA2_9GLOM|nr:1762_t:CDS:1 [Cetraspora pellucida]